MKNNTKNTSEWLIHFSADDWWQSNPHSRHHITRELHLKGYKVLWVNPMGLRFPTMKSSNFKKKIFNKVKSISKFLKKDNDYHIFTFLFLPVFKRSFFEKLNIILIRLQFAFVFRWLSIDKAVAFVTLPTFAPLVEHYNSKGFFEKILYYYSDQYEDYREISNKQVIIEWDEILRKEADAIYCASETIYNNVPDHYYDQKVVKVIEHQVDFDLFDFEKVKKVELSSIRHPIIGYYGSLSDSNDWDMIEYVAIRRPEWSFVFIGKKNIHLPSLENLKNVHFLDFVPYEELASQAINFDVGIMFWKMTDWIKACSPLKFKEYLALGLPVVSVPIDEVVMKYQKFVDIADDGPTFEKAIELSLQREDKESRREFAQSFSWKSAVDGIIDELSLR